LSHTWRNGPKARLNPDQHFTDEARSKAADWHRSDAGRLWHSRMALRTEGWLKWERAERPCEFCGKPMSALIREGNSQRFCTQACKAAAYRARDKSAVRECPSCKKTFLGLERPGVHQKYCSVKCKTDARRGTFKTQSAVCPQCATAFVARFHKNRNPRVFCSRECSFASRRDRAAARKSG
jgi:endogenous inhibitor of DNA gyrase (YacG/DUF329 family)